MTSATTDPAKPDAAFGLTARELEVLDLLVAGLTNREIGGRLFISENTAGVHVSNILGKLGASRRTEAATIAHRLGLIEAREHPDALAALDHAVERGVAVGQLDHVLPHVDPAVAIHRPRGRGTPRGTGEGIRVGVAHQSVVS